MAIKGMAHLRRKMHEALLDTIPSKAEKAAYIAVVTGGAFANTYTPVDTSFLINSQYSKVDTSGSLAIGRVGYTAKYAASVHAASGKLKGQPRAHFGKTRDGVEFGGGTEVGNYWDPDARPKWLSYAFDKHRAEIDKVVKKAMKL